ncbi:MAG: polysaccharide biosynthesis protein [Neisseriales bacterium]|nr:MAG: polysaccharide biosynthesis protein [Neisseriales bacterium]
MSRFNTLLLKQSPKMVWLILMDAVLLPLALLSAVLLRLGGVWDTALNPYWWIFVIPIIWILPIFTKLGLYRAALKYIDDQIVWTVFYGVSLTVLMLMAVMALLDMTVFPRSAVIIFWVFAMAYIGGIRFLLRGLFRRLDGHKASAIPVLIYGAGHAGLQLVAALRSSLEYQPVALLDDNAALWGHTYRGLSVYPPKAAKDLLHKTNAGAILLAMPSVSRSRQKKIIESLTDLCVPIKRLPSMVDIVSGEAIVQELKEIDIDDLLGRDIVPPDQTLLCADIANKQVLVTGAGGSIGSALCHQIAMLQPHKLILLDHSEYALYQIDQSLQQCAPQVPREAILCSIMDSKKVVSVLQSHQVNTIYHAAAYKHVPLVENNPIIGIANNALGTDALVQAAIDCQVNTLVFISTDKAVKPTSVMGATKRLAELILQMKQSVHKTTRLIIVRFGNVLGSSGSVVPLFRQQIAKGGPITITHPDMTRYFMALTEAAELVIQAGAMGQGGEIFVLDMGEPIRIVDLAKRMISLSGLTLKEGISQKGDIEICFTGIRPGEKIHEELWEDATVLPTQHPRIVQLKKTSKLPKLFDKNLMALAQACYHADNKQAMRYLHYLVKEFHNCS